MRPDAVVYTSNTGYTREYAEMMGDYTGLPVYELKEAVKILPRKSSVIYFGWIMAGRVRGYAKAARRFRIATVCGVGMGASGSQLEELNKVNAFQKDTQVFILKGGFDIGRLHGIYKFMMMIMVRALSENLENKTNRTPEEDDMLEMARHGKNCVDRDNLQVVCRWYQSLR